jgi:hypothetical protein
MRFLEIQQTDAEHEDTDLVVKARHSTSKYPPLYPLRGEEHPGGIIANQ